MSRVSHWILVIIIIIVVVVMCHWLLKIMILYRWSSTKLTGELAFKSVPQDAPALLPPQTSLPFFAFLSNRAKFFIRMCPSEKVWSLEEGVCSGIWTGGGEARAGCFQLMTGCPHWTIQSLPGHFCLSLSHSQLDHGQWSLRVWGDSSNSGFTTVLTF